VLEWLKMKIRTSFFIIGIILLFATSCIFSEKPDLVAERFARTWEQKDWNKMYDFFIPELQQKKTREEFATIMTFKERNTQVAVRLDGVSKDNAKETYAYYTVNSGIYGAKAPAMRLELTDDGWKVNAMSTIFNINTKKVYEYLPLEYFISIINKKLVNIENQLNKPNSNSYTMIRDTCGTSEQVSEIFETYNRQFDKINISFPELNELRNCYAEITSSNLDSAKMIKYQCETLQQYADQFSKTVLNDRLLSVFNDIFRITKKFKTCSDLNEKTLNEL
jgi:hypothetical protein